MSRAEELETRSVIQSAEDQVTPPRPTTVRRRVARQYYGLSTLAPWPASEFKSQRRIRAPQHPKLPLRTASGRGRTLTGSSNFPPGFSNPPLRQTAVLLNLPALAAIK